MLTLCQVILPKVLENIQIFSMLCLRIVEQILNQVILNRKLFGLQNQNKCNNVQNT